MMFALRVPPGKHTVRYQSNNGLVGFSGLYVTKELYSYINPVKFFKDHPDRTILIDMNITKKTGTWAFDSTAKYGEWLTSTTGTLEASFVGSQVFVYGTKNSQLKTFDIYIDGEFKQRANAANSERIDHAQLANISLKAGFHSIKLVFSSSGFTIDGFYFKPGGLERIPFTSLTYGGTWGIDDGSWAGEPTFGNYTTEVGAYVQYTFEGNI